MMNKQPQMRELAPKRLAERLSRYRHFLVIET